MSIYNEQATTQGAGLLNLGGISEIPKTIVKETTARAEQLEKEADKAGAKALDTFKQANKNLLSRTMRETYQNFSKDPVGFNKASDATYKEMEKAAKTPEEKLELRTQFELAVNPYVISVQDNFNKKQANLNVAAKVQSYYENSVVDTSVHSVAADNPELAADLLRGQTENLSRMESARDQNGNAIAPIGLVQAEREKINNPYYVNQLSKAQSIFAENPQELDKMLEGWENNQAKILAGTGTNKIDAPHLKKLIDFGKSLRDGSLKPGAPEASAEIDSTIATMNIQQGTSTDGRGKKTVSGQIKNANFNSVTKVNEVMKRVSDLYDNKLITLAKRNKHTATLLEARNLLFEQQKRLKPQYETSFWSLKDYTNEQSFVESSNDLFEDLEGDQESIRNLKERSYLKAFKEGQAAGIDFSVGDDKDKAKLDKMLMKSTIEVMEANKMDFFGFDKADIKDFKTLKSIIRKNKLQGIRRSLNITKVR